MRNRFLNRNVAYLDYGLESSMNEGLMNETFVHFKTNDLTAQKLQKSGESIRFLTPCLIQLNRNTFESIRYHLSYQKVKNSARYRS